jgi:ring-1,2-phenylacetyl-CoA epoxidase subunit PaaC
MTDDEGTAYDGLADAVGDVRWAFGSGFTDPLAGVDTTVPAGVDAAALAEYCLMLGDDALILSHRLQEWVTRLPELEEEVAVANIALDLLGQARLLLSRAGKADGTGRGEDDFAFGREQHEFRNVRIVEHPDTDFAELVLRLLVFATWRLAVFDRLVGCADPVLDAVAQKGSKELTYHRDFAAQWTVRLGDGTPVSHQRAQDALERIWPLVEELFRRSETERRLPGVAAEPALLREEVIGLLDTVLSAATLGRPDVAPLALVGGCAGRDGVHTQALSYVLAEMQSVARAHPGATW